MARAGLIPAFDDRDAAEGISLEYELVPGVEATDGGGGFFRYVVGVEYSADVELPWEPYDGGVIAPCRGAPSTHGSRGDWPLPNGARRLTFTPYPVEESGFQSAVAAGSIEVDLTEGSAVWVPAR